MGVGVVLTASVGVLALLCPNPEKPVEAKGEAGAGLVPNPDAPKAGLETFCWKESGLFAGALGFSGELSGVSSELLNGAATRGELLLGALELKPRNEPLLEAAEAGATFAAGAEEALAGLLLLDALAFGGVSLEPGSIAAPEVVDLVKFAKENAAASLFCVEPEAGSVPKPPKPLKPADFAADEVCVGLRVFVNEKGDLEVCGSVDTGLSGSLLGLDCFVELNAEEAEASVVSAALGAKAKEEGAGGVGFESALPSVAEGGSVLLAGSNENDGGEAADLTAALEKPKEGLGDSTWVLLRSSSWPFVGSAIFCFASSVALTLAVDDASTGAVALGLLLPNEKGWLPNAEPVLKPGLKELNAGVDIDGDVALETSASLPGVSVALALEDTEELNEKGFVAGSPFGVWVAKSLSELGIVVP